MSQKINKLGNIDTFLNDCIDYGILDEEQESKKIEYLVAKNYLKEFVDSLNSVSVSFKGSIVFENNNLNAEHLIYKINEVLQLKIKNSSLNIIELKKEKDDEEESMLISGGGSGKNSEYEKMVNFLNKKEEIIRFITVFVDLFNNTLNLTERKIIYLDLGQYFGHKKVKFLSSLSCKLLTFFRSQIVNRSMNSFAIIPAFYVLK